MDISSQNISKINIHSILNHTYVDLDTVEDDSDNAEGEDNDSQQRTIQT